MPGVMVCRGILNTVNVNSESYKTMLQEVVFPELENNQTIEFTISNCLSDYKFEANYILVMKYESC